VRILMTREKSRLWVFSEVFYPEETGTGHYITKIAEHLAQTRDVAALCVQPSYSRAGGLAPAREVHNGVEIYRCAAVLPRQKTLAARLVKMTSITFSLLLNALFRVTSDDSILVVTNPPTLPVVAALISLWRGVPYTLVVHDLYPDLMAACGLTTSRSVWFRLMRRVNRFVLRRASKIITIGHDMMAALAEARATGTDDDISVIPLWSDCLDVHPRKKEENPLAARLGLGSKLVVLYAGNMGHPHGMETLAAAARILAHDDEIHFLFIGSGPKRRVIEELVESGARNITILDPRPRADQEEFLNACDVAILSLVPGMLGLAVPSRTYNIMAAGKPVIALVASASETAKVVREEEIGWVVQPGDPQQAVSAILEAKGNRQRLCQMGKRARAAAETKYSPESILKQFENLLSNSSSGTTKHNLTLQDPVTQ
jgi:colanic acid biosynthesis glycosyl transferase WcaI